MFSRETTVPEWSNVCRTEKQTNQTESIATRRYLSMPFSDPHAASLAITISVLPLSVRETIFALQIYKHNIVLSLQDYIGPKSGLQSRVSFFHHAAPFFFNYI